MTDTTHSPEENLAFPTRTRPGRSSGAKSALPVLTPGGSQSDGPDGSRLAGTGHEYLVSFRGRKPVTAVSLTPSRREAFTQYLGALSGLIGKS